VVFTWEWHSTPRRFSIHSGFDHFHPPRPQEPELGPGALGEAEGSLDRAGVGPGPLYKGATHCYSLLAVGDEALALTGRVLRKRAPGRATSPVSPASQTMQTCQRDSER